MLLPGNIVQVDERALYSSGLRYEDLVGAVDIVVTKPGYGIIAECVANDTAICTRHADISSEYSVLVREMPRWLRADSSRTRICSAGAGRSRWIGCARQPPPPETIATDGAERPSSGSGDVVEALGTQDTWIRVEGLKLLSPEIPESGVF